jgi:hypothetical protein
MLNQKKRLSILSLFVFIFFACRFSGQVSEIPPQNATSVEKKTATSTAEEQFPVVSTHTPQSFPSSLQPWLIGHWQEVNSGEIYRFTEDFQFIRGGNPDLRLGYYRFTSETEVLLPWKGELLEVEIWQLDQNSLLINFPDGLGVKFIRISS